ncbi:uncharacterized protein N7482_000026 [Penicillium canariense]|uniref:Beta-lactamase-related domain-containing protein n=1 Tax=Penicillium canariense TaxID=189055 RepID=A0A9W9IDF1_9EURO|nr:uncharacterized protein N7482_000026 [Penicillium canariense]KAJ5174149.1 hypothetical protein N7482_000026 [Penicillium canariense]
MDSLEKTFEDACSNGVIPGAVLAASSKDGCFTYCKAFGFSSLEDHTPLDKSAVFALASCTKLITTIAALQQIEQGKISLEDDVACVVPELARLEIVSETPDGDLKFTKRTQPITLRHLLTHSSGKSYDFMAPVLQKYNKSKGLPPMPPNRSVVETYASPLIFEPGTSWHYGSSVDWAGLVVERLSGMDLDTYFKQNIFEPLGIFDMTFWPGKSAQVQAKRVAGSVRSPDGNVVPFKGPSFVAGATAPLGGQGLYASVPSYLKILQSILVDNEKLLKKETSAMMFTPQLAEESRSELQALYKSQPQSGPCSIGYFPPDTKYSWGLGGLLTMEDVNECGPGYRRRNCLTWSGALNSFWFIDREAQVCGIYGGEAIPPGDRKINQMIITFEKAIYQQKAQDGHPYGIVSRNTTNTRIVSKKYKVLIVIIATTPTTALQ